MHSKLTVYRFYLKTQREDHMQIQFKQVLSLNCIDFHEMQRYHPRNQQFAPENGWLEY